MLYKTLKPQNFIHGEVKRTYFYNPIFYRFELMPFEKNSINHRTNMLITGISKNTRQEIILGSLLHKNLRAQNFIPGQVKENSHFYNPIFLGIPSIKAQNSVKPEIRYETKIVYHVSFGSRASNKIVKLDRFKVAISR